MSDAGPAPVTIGTVLADATRALSKAGSTTPALDARLLMAHVLDLQIGALLAEKDHPISAKAAETMRACVARRASGEPVHRILGERGFYEHDFLLSPDTLEPRPDTETLVELCIEIGTRIFAGQGRCVMVDIGTGSGAIAVSLLAALPFASAVATDISQGALATAWTNARRAGVESRCFPVVANYLDPLGGPFDLLVSNPPYIPSADIEGLDRAVRDFDPRRALDGGADGLDAYRQIAGQAPRVLAPAGFVALEIGQGQADDVTSIFEANGFLRRDRRRDLGGVMRALSFQLL